MRNTRNKKNSFNWNKVQRFSIRKLSFGVASCMIGAQFVLSGLNHTAKADGITAYEANGDKVTAYAHGESVYKLRGTSTSIYNAFWMDVDTSKYTKENPIIKVTLTYNAKDNQTGNAPIFWSGRPMHWFTVPEATEELGRDYKLSLTNGSGNTMEFSDWRSWESNSRFIHSKYKGNPDAWERYNTTTTEMLKKTPFVSLNSEFNKVLGDNNNRWYDNSNMPTQDIMRDLRAKSNSIYIDWEKRAAGTVTVSYTTKVKDPEKTKEITIGMGVYQPSNAQQYARVETIKLPVLYKLNEVFEPKEPERTAVADITNLKDDEIAIIREKIWAANLNNTSTLLSTNNAFKDNLKDSSNSGANSIVIDRTTGKATIIYKDDTTDTIEGSNLIYKKPEPAKPVTPSEGPKEDKEQNLNYYTNPVEVESLNNISQRDRDNALKSFLKVNLTQEGYNKFENGYTAFTNDDFKPGVKFNLDNGKKATFILDRNQNYIRIARERPAGTLGIVPKEQLFKEKAKPAFDISAAKEEANKLIESLDNLYPNEKLGYKAIIANATDRDSIEIEVNKAKAKANENAVELAKIKKDANDKINALGYLTKEEKEEAIAKINSATIKQRDNSVDNAVTSGKADTDANRDDTRDRLNSVVNELVQQNLQKARQKAIETINSIPNEDLSSDKKTDYINKINAASKIGPASEEGTILNIVEKAQKEASAKEAARKKEEADKVRQQYKDMIANIPGLTDEEKTEYNNAIDAANNVGEMESIVEFARLTGERKKAIVELGKLDYLNNNQKQSFIDAINDSTTKAELDYYVSQATQLNSKMKQLHDLAAEARKIKPENGAPQDKYTSAAAEKQTAFNNALADAERVLNKATGADEAITSVGKLFTALETAINELKPGEKVIIPADKSALKAEYDKGDSVKKSPAYTKETNPDKKKAYDDALKEAKKVLDQSDASQDAVDKALEDLEVAKAGLNGKQDEFVLTKRNENAVPISIEPVKGEIVSKTEDKDLILGKIDGIPTGATVIYNPIVEKANKKYVPVKVTHENISKEIEIEVVQSVASKVTPEVSTAKLSEVPKENGTITKKSDVQKVKDAVKLPEVPKDQPQPTKELVDGGKVVQGTDQSGNGGANNTGKLVVKVEIKYPDGSKETVEVPVEASDAAKATPKVKEEITSGEVPVSVDPSKDKKVAEADKKAITDAVVVPEGQPQPTDKQVKNDGEIVEGTGANTGKKVVVVEVKYPDGSKDEIEVPVRKATDKDKAKADLTEAAEEEKKEIDADNGLTKSEKDDFKQKVDKVKKEQEANIDKANTPEEVASATTNGKQAIAGVHTPTDIKEYSKKLNKPENKVKVTDTKHLTDEEKEKVKDAVVEANRGLSKDDITVDDKGNVTTPKGFLLPEDVITQALNKPAKPVVVADPNHLKNEEKEKVKDAVAEANPGLHKDDITVDDKGNVSTTNGDKLLAKDVVTPALKKPTTPVVVENSASLTDKEKEDIKDAVVAENPGLNKGNVTVNPDGSVTTPKGNLPKEDVVTTVLNKPNKLVEVENPNSLTVKEKEAVKEAVANANPGLDKKNIKVDDQGNVTTPKGNLSAKDVVTSTLKKPTTPVEVVNLSKLTDPEKSKVVEEIIKNNPGLTDKDIKVDDQGNVETPKGNLPSEDVVTPALKKPTKPVEVKDPSNLTEKEKEEVKKAVIEANKDANGQPTLSGDQVTVNNDGSVTTPKGNLPSEDVVTPALKKPTTPVEVKDPNNLTEKEKEEVKKAVIEANKDANGQPTLNGDQVTVNNDGSVTTPKGNLPAKDVVKTKVETSKGESLKFDIPELSYQDAVVAGVVAVEKGKELTDKDILTQLALGEGAVTAKVIFKPATTEIGTKEAEVEVTLADGRKVTVKVPVVVYEGERPEVNDLAKAKEDAKKQVEEAANKKIEEINKRTDLSVPEKTAAIEKVNKAKEDAKSQIENATSAGTAKAIGKEAADKIAEFKPEHDSVKPLDSSKLDEEKAKAIAEIEQVAKDQIDAIKNNAGLIQEQKDKAIKKIEDLKAKAIEDVRKATSKDEVANVVKDVETAIKKVDPQPSYPTPQPQPGNNGGNGLNQNAQANSDAVDYAKQAAKNILEEAARAKKAQLEEAGLSDAEKEELFAKVDAEKQAALDEIAKAKDVDTVKQLVTKAVAKIKAIQPARNAQDNQDSQDAQNAQNAQDAQNNSNSNPTSLDAANVRGQELPATGTGSEFVVFNAAAISILTGLGLAIPSKKKETEK